MTMKIETGNVNGRNVRRRVDVGTRKKRRKTKKENGKRSKEEWLCLVYVF